jgi:putative transposase
MVAALSLLIVIVGGMGVVGAFPDGQSCLNLAAARLRYIAGTAWSTKRYMNMRPLHQPQVMQTGAVA